MTENQALRAAAMPLVGQAVPLTADWAEAVNFQAMNHTGSGVSYASPKLGTQSYSAGSLTTGAHVI